MIVAPGVIVAAASSALVFTLASQSARNMIQTARIASSASRRLKDSATTTTTTESSSLSDLLEGADPGSISDRLRELNRADLLRVFAESRAPTLEELEEITGGSGGGDDDDDDDGSNDSTSCTILAAAEWDGVLLDNNSWVMDLCSSVLTNGLFGGIALPWRLADTAKGPWKGKAFSKPQKPGTTHGRGINRFRGSGTKQQQQQQQQQQQSSVFFRHGFDYSIGNSRLVPGTQSLRLSYSGYQSLPISLWHSMNDELRVVELPSKNDDHENNDNNSGTSDELVLIGMGWMGWSGGPLNCSPFLLERARPSSSPELSSSSLTEQTAEL